MANSITPGIDEEELRRQQEEAERIAREEAARAEREAAEQAARAQAETEQAAAEAAESAQRQTESTVQETAPLNPAAPETPDPAYAGVRSFGPGKISKQDRLNIQFANETRSALEDTVYRVGKYDTEDRYSPEESKGKFVNRIASHALGTPSAEETGNQTYIDYGSVRSKEQAFALMMVYSDDAAKVKGGKKLANAVGMDYESFLAEAENYMYDKYGRNVFSTPYSPAAKNRAYTAKMDGIGLMGVDGSPLDIGTATTADIFRACKMDPSGETADAVYALVKEAAKIPGNPWYGMDVKEDMFKFVDSADLTSADYKDWVDDINTSFTYSDGLTEENLAAFLSLYDDILADFGGNQRVANYMIRDLNKSFGEHTGYNAPTKEEAERALAEIRASGVVDSENEGDRKSFVGAIKDWLSSGTEWFKNLGKKETETGEPVEYKTVEQIIEEEKNKTAGGNASVMSGGTASVNGQDLAVSVPIASASMPSSGELFPDGGTQEETGFDNPLGLSREMLEQSRSKESVGPIYDPEKNYTAVMGYDAEMTDEQAWAAYRAGYRLAPENYNQISRYAGNPEINGVLYGEAAEYQAGSGGSSSALENMSIQSYRKHGHFLGELAQDIAASDLDRDGKAVAEMALMQLTADIYDMWADPQSGLSRPKGANMYDHVFETDRTFLERYYGIKDSLRTANTAYSDNVVRNEEEREARLAGYTEAMLSGRGDQAMADALADAYSMDWVDVESDDKRNALMADLHGSTSIYADGGTFWKGESMAALEYKAIKGAGSNQGAMDFRQDLIQRTGELIDSYTTAAHNIGTTLEKYLSSAGITSADQLMNIAYNGMQMEGKSMLADAGFQNAIDTASTAHAGSVGALVNGDPNYLRTGDQIGLGADIGWTNYWESMAQAGYIATDIATHGLAVQNIQNEYVGKYGLQAAEMYRRDLNEVIASGALSQEMAAELQANMARAYSIFDVGYEIDANGLKGVLRQSQAELGKKLDTLNTVVRSLAPEQQRLVGLVSGFTQNLTGMGMTVATAGVARWIGAPVAAANALGSVVGTGATTFSSAYDSNVHEKGMSKGVAASSAFFEAMGMTLIENGNTGSLTDLFFGGAGVEGMQLMARKGKRNLVAAMGGALASSAVGEGLEEATQTVGEHVFDILDAEWQAIERGEGFSPSRTLRTLESGLRETDYAALGKEALTSFGAGMAYGVVFGIAGVAKSGRAAFKDAQAFNKYESVKLATQIAEGSIEATDENLGKLYALMGKDLSDPAYCRYLDKGSVQATKDRRVMTAMLENTASETLNSAVGHAMKAQEYQDKADAASVASETAKSQFLEVGEKVENGELKPSEMDDALAQWQKAQTAYNEAYAAANKEIATAGRDTDAWLKACMERAGVLTSEGMKVRMSQIANARIGLAKRLYALYAKADRARLDYEASLERDAKAQAEVDYAENAVFGEDAEIDEDLAVMADEDLDEDIEGLNAQIAEAEARVADVSSRQEELGIGGDTIRALVEQELAPLSKKKDRIIAREKGRFNDAFDRMQQALEMDNDDAANEIQAEYDAIASRLQTLGVDTDALIAQQYGIDPEEANTAYEEAQAQDAQRAEDEKYEKLTDDLSRRMEATNAGLETINPARWYFAKNPIYVNESQAADILAAEGLKSIGQFNWRYGTKLTTEKGNGAMPLDEHVLSDIAAEAAGSVHTDGDPVAEMLTVLQTGKKLTATQKAEKAEAKALTEQKKAEDEARRAKVKAIARPESNIDRIVAPAQRQPEVEAPVDEASTVDMAAGSGTAKQTPAQRRPKRSKRLEGSALKAIQNLAREMKVGLRIKSGQRFQSAGSRMGKGVLGYYTGGRRNAIVRSADAGRVSVTGHEIGHALQEQLGIQSNQQMIRSWQNTFGNTSAYTPQQYDHEAFAEFFWRYLTSRDAAVAYAGDSYVDSFEQAMRRKKLHKAVAKAQAQVSAYMDSEVDAKIRARMVNAYEAKTPEDTAYLRRVEIRWADDTSAAEDLQDVIRARTGEKHLSLEDNLRDKIRFNRRAAARANESLTKQLVDLNGDYVGESLKDALSDVEGKDFDLFWEYELAKHSLARDTAKGAKNQVFDEDTLSTADRQAFVAKVEKEHPEFKTANARFQKWRRLFMDTYLVNNGFLGDPVQAGLLMDALEAAYPNYVPTYRVKGKRDKAATIGGRKYQMRTATGSTEDIINPFDSFVSMVNSIVRMAADNDSRKKFADLYDRYGTPLPGETGPGIGLFANEITQDMQRVSVSTTDLREKITKMLDTLGTDPDVIMQISDIIGDEKVEYHGTGRVNLNNVITVRGEDGSKRYFEIYNPELFELLAATNTPNDPGVLDKIAKATRLMSMLTTGSNPVFGLTNMMRDFQNSVNYGSWASNYADGAVKWIGALWDVVSKGEASEEYDALGGGGWTAFDTKTKKGAEQVRGEVFKGYNTSNVGRIGKMVGRTIWKVATLEKVNEAIEKASRVAEYKYGKHDRTTTEGRIEAFLAAQDVTTDFSRRGNGRVAQELKSLVPFFNASMQGIYRNARQFTAQESDRAGIRFAKNVINASLASAIANGILLAALDEDEKEEFAYLSDDLKAKHMFLPNFAPDIFGDAALIRIPLDQNPITYAVNAAMANFIWHGETDNEFIIEIAAVADVIKNNLNPVGGTIFDPAISMLSNKNWYGSDIVPSYLESYDETNQYTEETPTPFVAISKGLSGVGIKVSPMMLQYLAEQYTGYIGQTIIPALPSEKNQNGIVSGALDALVATARKRVTSDPLVSNDVISTVYDSFDEMTEVYKAGSSKRGFDIDYLNPSLSDRDRRRAIREADDLIHSGGEIYEAKQDISAGYDKIDQINERDDLTDEEKHTLTQKIRREMIETALDVREVMNDYDTRYKNDDIMKRFMNWLWG